MSTENYLLSVQGVAQTSYNECVMCFQSAGLSSSDTLDAAGDLCNAWQTHAMSAWVACLPDTYQVLRIAARRAFPTPSAEAHLSFPVGTWLGTGGADGTSLSLCPAVFLVPPMGTKSGGRIFMPAIFKGAISNNTYAGGYVTLIDTLLGVLTAGLAGSGTNWKLAVYSRKNVSASLVNTWVLSPRIGFQGRRRKPVGGT